MPHPPNPAWRKRVLVDNRPLRRVEGEGPVPADIMLIGERPGEKEAKSGRPFVGAAGQILNLGLSLAEIDRRSLYITNLVKEYRDYDKPTQEEIDAERPWVETELEMVHPRVVGLMGTFAVEEMLDRDRAGLERTHGIPVWKDGRLWLPMYHPAAGIYNQDTMPRVLADIIALGMVADGKLLPLVDHWKGVEQYVEVSGGYTVRADSAIDTEGSKGAPWCLTYSVKPGGSFLVRPDTGPPIVFEGHVYLHNSLHDLAVMRRLGVHLADNQFTDTMVLAYLLCIEPQGLKDLAYRHAGMTMHSYDEVINTGGANRDKAIEYLMGVDSVEWKETPPYVAMEGGRAKVKKPHSINRRVRGILADISKDKRKKDGSPVDPRERWGNIEGYVKQEVVETLGEMPETTLDDIPIEVATDYACRDSDATLRIAPILKAKISEMGLDRVARIDHDTIPMIDAMGEHGMQLAPQQLWDDIEARCDEQMEKARYNIYNCTGWEINPDSPKQCAELLFDYLHLPIIKWTEGGDASTQDKALEAIVRTHPVVDMVLTYREVAKSSRVMSVRYEDAPFKVTVEYIATSGSPGWPVVDSPPLDLICWQFLFDLNSVRKSEGGSWHPPVGVSVTGTSTKSK